MRRTIGRAAEQVGPWEQLAEGRAPLVFPRGHQIYTPDQPADALLLLAGGQVGLHLISDEGRALTLRVIDPEKNIQGTSPANAKR